MVYKRLRDDKNRLGVGNPLVDRLELRYRRCKFAFYYSCIHRSGIFTYVENGIIATFRALGPPSRSRQKPWFIASTSVLGVAQAFDVLSRSRLSPGSVVRHNVHSFRSYPRLVQVNRTTNTQVFGSSALYTCRDGSPLDYPTISSKCIYTSLHRYAFPCRKSTGRLCVHYRQLRVPIQVVYCAPASGLNCNCYQTQYRMLILFTVHT